MFLLLAIGATVADPVLAAENEAAAPQPPTLNELRQLIAEQQALSQRQSAQIDALSKEVSSLRLRLDQVASSAAAQPPLSAIEARVAAIEQSVALLPEMPQQVVTAGDFPGSIAVPGTGTNLKLGGQARFTAVHTLGPLGTDDRFIASSIPVDGQLAAEGERTAYIATPTRLNFDLRAPAPFGGFRTFVEADFAGAGNTARLRHAFIQTDKWLFGQTWSTFSDPEAEPLDIDFEGLNAISRFRQAQLRYSRPLDRSLRIAVALEDPAPDLTGAQGINLAPDVVARLRWEPANGDQGIHVQGAVIGRILRGAPTSQPTSPVSTGGFGFTFSGAIPLPWAAADRFKFATNDGFGIGRYITDLSAAGGQDAVYDPIANTLRALPVSSALLAYEHRWSPRFLTVFSYGLVTVHNLDVQAGESLHRTHRGAASLTWNPFSRGDLVFEYLGGQRVNKDGDSGTPSQVQVGWRIRF